MRLTSSNFGTRFIKYRATKGKGRAPQNVNEIRFQEVIPLALKNKVSTKSEKTADAGCIQDMAVMFACLKENNFAESACTEEIKVFKECYTRHMEARALKKKQSALGELIPGAKTLPSTSLNKLLRKFPQPNDPLRKIENP